MVFLCTGTPLFVLPIPDIVANVPVIGIDVQNCNSAKRYVQYLE